MIMIAGSLFLSTSCTTLVVKPPVTIAPRVEDTPNDAVWLFGKDGKGGIVGAYLDNCRTLMRIRDEDPERCEIMKRRE